jgi:hypothetical protein
MKPQAIRRSVIYLRALHACPRRCQHAHDAAEATEAVTEGERALSTMARNDTALLLFGLVIVAVLLHGVLP